MSNDPYTILGVDTGADDATIKRAYRRRSRESHPDKGGSDDEFASVASAYALLSNPDDRAHYDRTGRAPESRPAIEELGEALFMGTLSSIIEAGVSDEKSLLAQVKGALDKQIADCRIGINHLKRDLEKLNAQLDRYGCTINPADDAPYAEENLIESALKTAIAKREKAMAMGKEELATASSALIHCERYKDTRPPSPSVSAWSVSARRPGGLYEAMSMDEFFAQNPDLDFR